MHILTNVNIACKNHHQSWVTIVSSQQTLGVSVPTQWSAVLGCTWQHDSDSHLSMIEVIPCAPSIPLMGTHVQWNRGHVYCWGQNGMEFYRILLQLHTLVLSSCMWCIPCKVVKTLDFKIDNLPQNTSIWANIDALDYRHMLRPR